MESNRIVTRVSVGIYAALGLPSIVAAFFGILAPIFVWILLPFACLIGVLLEFVVFGPLMILTAWIAGGRSEDPRSKPGD